MITQLVSAGSKSNKSVNFEPGKPYSLMKASASPYASTGPGVPGTTGTPTFMAIERTLTRCQSKQSVRQKRKKTVPSVRAFVLSPSPSMTSGVGPTKAIPACSTFLANSAFSDKNPYLREAAVLSASVREDAKEDKSNGRKNRLTCQNQRTEYGSRRRHTQDGSCQHHAPTQF